MRTLTLYNFLTLNGFYKDPFGDTNWHKQGNEESKYSEESIARDNILLFGRKTYEMMNSFWPTPMAYQSFPVVAEGMNKAEKIVFSRSMDSADWNNTIVIRDNIVEKVRELKETPGKDLTILGSGSIASQFAEEGLIDRFEIMIDPVLLGAGTSLVSGIKEPLNLKLINSRVFPSGVVLLEYAVSN